MDLLVVLSITTSYFASLAMLILDVRSSPESNNVGTYFDSSVFLIMFILLGRCLEGYAKSRTTDAVALLGSLRPETALLVRPAAPLTPLDSEAIESALKQTDAPSTRPIPVAHLELGDHIVVPPGALPPTDGIVVSGNTTFDESSLTGESKHVPKGPGDDVFTGTTNRTGAITVRVTRLGQETMLEKIMSAVSDASARKAPIEKLAERLTGVFVPIIVYLSLITLTVWLSLALTGRLDGTDHNKPGGRVFFALEFAIATLVVACPCGIGLAVPCANAVGNGIAANAGILAAGGGEAFLGATQVGIVAVDKTGTLTVGKSQVRDEWWMRGPIEQETLRKAIVAVEGQSTHPLAVGLVEHLGLATGIDIVDTEEISGRGLKASVKISEITLEILVGNLAHLETHHVNLNDEERETILSWQEKANSIILVALRPSGTEMYAMAAMFSLSDPPREDASGVIGDLKKRGLEVIMLTGDNEVTARAMAREVGMDANSVRAGLGPEGKAEVVTELQARTRVYEKNGLARWWRRLLGGGEKKEVVLFVGGKSARITPLSAK